MIHVEVKLYSYHDMDLVSLYKSGRIVFPETTRQVLNSYANKEVYKIKLLQTNHKREKRYPRDTYRKYYHYHVDLDEERDAPAIKLLESITPGCRNNFIKVLLRQYICCEIPAGYSVDGKTKLFKTMTALFQNGLEEREIRQTKHKNNEKPQDEGLNKNKDKNRDTAQEVVKKEKKDFNSSVSQKRAQDMSQHVTQNVTQNPAASDISQKPEIFTSKENIIENTVEDGSNKAIENAVEDTIEDNIEETVEDSYDDDDFDIDAFLSGATEQY